jgi:hypothetical protein
MPSHTPPAGSARQIPGAPGPTPPRRAAVDAVAQSLVGEYLIERKEEREALARIQRPPRPWRRILSLTAIVACGAVWLVPSLGTRPAPAMSVERQDASARLALFLAAQRVREYEQRQGRLPRSVAQTGISDPRISYRLTGQSSFTLSLVHNGERWDLPSAAADTVYMRNALARLGGAARSK